jgi:hypothetical protein
MIDAVFKDAVFWLFMDYSIKLGLIGFITFVCLMVSFFYVVRKWGDV